MFCTTERLPIVVKRARRALLHPPPPLCDDNYYKVVKKSASRVAANGGFPSTPEIPKEPRVFVHDQTIARNYRCVAILATVQWPHTAIPHEPKNRERTKRKFDFLSLNRGQGGEAFGARAVQFQKYFALAPKKTQHKPTCHFCFCV